MASLTKSIRWRFVLWLAFLLVCVLSGFGITAFQLHRTNRFNELDEELKHRLSVLSTALRTPPRRGESINQYDRDRDAAGSLRENQINLQEPPDKTPGQSPGGPDDDDRPRDRDRHAREHHGGRDGDNWRNAPRTDVRTSSEVRGLFDESSTNGFYFAMWSRNDRTAFSVSSNAPPELERPNRPGNDTRAYFQMHGELREVWHYTERGDCVLVGHSVVTEVAATQRFAFWLITGGLGVLALGITGGWLIAGRVLKPVKQIGVTADRIAAGNLSERINVSETDDELGQLVATLNSSFTRLEASFEQQKQFTADASHELRTPLAVMISEAQTALARERSAAEYRETVEACLDTAQQMRRLTESLLELARFDANQHQLRRQPVDLAKAVRGCIEMIHPLADARAVKIQTDLSPAPAAGDASLLQQVITNLLTNAIHYNKPAGEVRVQTRAENGQAILAVTDTGRGISPEDLPHVFKRFYRADKARGRAEGCSGLGLAICKSIVTLHGGTIEAASEAGAGATFTVRLPLSA